MMTKQKSQVEQHEDMAKNLEEHLPEEQILHNFMLQPDANLDLDSDNFALFAKKAMGMPQEGRKQHEPLDQSIKMLCDTHKAPAVFFSNKEDRYVCFKCLVSSEKLLYIDKSYKMEMEYFEKIKEMTILAIKSN